MAPALLLTLALVSLAPWEAACQFSNLPTVSPGIFNASARIEIQSNLSLAWNVLTDFSSYPNWNPFVRLAEVIAPEGLSLPEQRPVENAKLVFRVQIPPLPLPVNAETPDNLLHTQTSTENVTHVQQQQGRLAWEYTGLPSALLASERWQAISDLGGGVILYESREVFSGSLASTLNATMGEGLQQAFEAQAQGLKLALEGRA